MNRHRKLASNMEVQTLPLLLLMSSLLLFTLCRAEDFIIDKYEYIGYKNMLHNDVDKHMGINVGGHLETDKFRIRNDCAGHCSLDDDCDAFYLEEKVSGNCHLVDEDLSPGVEPYVGHGWQLENIYYVKQDADQQIGAREVPEELIPPCDLDDTELDQTTCSAFPANMTTYYTCADSSAK